MGADSAPGESRSDAQVVAVDKARFLVEADGATLSCFARKRLGPLVCGDRVRIRIAGSEEGVIEAVHPRTSLVYRSDRKRQKPIAANVDAALLVLAVSPTSGTDFVDRALAAAEYAGLDVLIVLNKMDVRSGADSAAEQLAAYAAIGYATAAISARESAEALQAFLAGHSSVLIGRSGVGKSTILNALLPAARARTGGVSRTEAGRHTTTRARLYRLDPHASLIDAPGMQQFGVQHIPVQELAATFREFRSFLGQCRFHNCLHVGEPHCALAAALEHGAITSARMASYGEIVRSLREPTSGARRAKPAGHRHQKDHEQP